MTRKTVQSAAVKSFGYEEETRTLEVEYASGGVYRYAPVLKDTAELMRTAGDTGTSIGKLLNSVRKMPAVVATKVEVPAS
ncbi:MAG TPA: KTSC domain-containing protein [Candidatus Tumulicola sp.]|jgi:hypothetical protein